MDALAPVRTVAPATDPISLDEAKAHLRVDHADDDTGIAAMIVAATSHLDGWSGTLGRALITQTWARSWSAFPHDGRIRLPLEPVQSVTSITYYDAANVKKTLDAADYGLATDAYGSFVWRRAGTSWPATYSRPDAVTVTAVYGYGDAGSDVPAPIRHALFLMVSDMYEHRQSVSDGSMPVIDVPTSAMRLLSPYTRVRFG